MTPSGLAERWDAELWGWAGDHIREPAVWPWVRAFSWQAVYVVLAPVLAGGREIMTVVDGRTEGRGSVSAGHPPQAGASGTIFSLA